MINFNNNNSGLLDEEGNFLPADYNNNSIQLTPSIQSVTQELQDRQKSIQNFLEKYKKYKNVSNTNVSNKFNTMDKKAQYLMYRMQKELGLTKAQAAGIAGNIWVESKFNPKAVGDKGAAHGIAQWHLSRRKGIDMLNTSYEDQVTHIINELKGSEKEALIKLRRTTTPQQAAASFDKLYERSDGKSRKSREEQAIKYFNMI